MGIAVEQLAAEQHLQALDLRAYRGLGDAERNRSFGETAVIDDRDQRAQEFRGNIGHMSPFKTAPQIYMRTNTTLFRHSNVAPRR